MIHFVTFANKLFKARQKCLSFYAKQLEMEPLAFTEKWLKRRPFYRENKAILSQNRGCGYWLWKPFIILHTMQNTPDGDLIIYFDSGGFFEKDLIDGVKQHLLDKGNVCALVKGDNHTNKDWTKRDCFTFMGCDEERYWNAVQVEAGFSAWRNSPEARDIVQEWLGYAQDERILTDLPNQCGKPNFPSFNDHRHDQSILTNIAVRSNLSVSSEWHPWIYFQQNRTRYAKKFRKRPQEMLRVIKERLDTCKY